MKDDWLGTVIALNPLGETRGFIWNGKTGHPTDPLKEQPK
jgi:hypothetical protein